MSFISLYITRLAAGSVDGKVRIYSTGTVATEKRVERPQGSVARLPCSYAGRHFTPFWKKGEPTGSYENASVVPIDTGGRYQITADHSLIIPNVHKEDSGTYYCGVGLGGESETEIHGATELVISPTATTTGSAEPEMPQTPQTPQTATTAGGAGKVIGAVLGGIVGVGALAAVFAGLKARKLGQEGNDSTDCQLIGTAVTSCLSTHQHQPVPGEPPAVGSDDESGELDL